MFLPLALNKLRLLPLANAHCIMIRKKRTENPGSPENEKQAAENICSLPEGSDFDRIRVRMVIENVEFVQN